MNEWILAAIGLLLGFIPLGVIAWRGAPLRAVIALELIGLFSIQVLFFLAEGFHRTALTELGMVLAILSLPSGLVFLRIFERWL